MMHQLPILYTTLLYAWAALASDDDRYLRGQGVGYICLDTGKRTGKQTLEVPTEMVDFFTSPHRTNPAKTGNCSNKDGKKTIASCCLTEEQAQSRLFCKNVRDTMVTLRTVNAATEWMLANGFKDEGCIDRSRSTSKLRYIPPQRTRRYGGTRLFGTRSCECRSTTDD